jgi:hypothetical protein
MATVSRRLRNLAVLAVALAAALASLVAPTAGAVGDLSAVTSIQTPASATERAVRLEFVTPTPTVTGYKSLFIGHSFFVPVAGRMEFFAPDAGLPDHTQETVFSGGATGAPLALWEAPAKRAAVQTQLDGGDIELFGMTYHPDYPGLEGYENWVDYALTRNPTTKFFIGFPWLTNPGSMSADTFSATWQGAYESIAFGIVDDLRSAYPGVDFFAIPYGRAAAELYSLFEAGDLPDVDSLVSNAGEGIFRDSFGHADEILLELAALVWMRAIYDVDLSSYDYDPGYSTDLKAIADAIMDDHDANYDAP